ncbi:hypothetical protein SK128_026507 [Halocaridina rubra]|uniref:Uncharacterized protein n=1 Tax=Halocaridina rubra TaxID=373956 RepID=A0AAN8XWQ2_HALRR
MEKNAEDGGASRRRRGRSKMRFVDVAKEDMRVRHVTEDDTDDGATWCQEINAEQKCNYTVISFNYDLTLIYDLVLPEKGSDEKGKKFTVE